MAVNCEQFHEDEAVTGQVKIEYAFETVRVRIYLPQWGETWFFIDKSTTVEEFLQQVKKEDDFLTTVSLWDSDQKTNEKKECKHNQKNLKIYDVLTSYDKVKHYIQLNDNFHLIPSVGTVDINHDVDSLADGL